MPRWLIQLLIKLKIIRIPDDDGDKMITLDALKKAAISEFENGGKVFVDNIVNHYKEVGADKLEQAKRFGALLVANGKDLIDGKINISTHDQNVEDLWNAQKSDALSTAYEEKVTIIKAFVDGLGVLAKMAVGIFGSLKG